MADISRDPEALAIALRAARTVRGFSRRQVAEGAGVPLFRLASFERGQIRPTPSEMGALWEFLCEPSQAAEETK